MTNSRVKVKVCGMTQPAQVRAAVEFGVDAIGMIMYADSPRQISLQKAQQIRAQVPAFVSLVGVFVDCDVAHVNALATAIGLDLVQLHGAEGPEYAEQLNTPYIKAIRAQSQAQIEAEIALHPHARAILLDPYVTGQHGGTGQALDLKMWPSSAQKLILAGGLAPGNVAAAVDQVQPYAVDLNSGLESSPGEKQLDLLEQALRELGR